ncbi:hypothetical protein [Roseomonas chloroacetimidivorans]|uniref:hypothetical protein n=1 Tax=Roseomonas chloroacetimidivorans TaxID=1766656 RepID=UPI003C7473B5
MGWKDRRALSWDALCEILTTHEEGAKEGTCIIPAVFFGERRKKEEAERIDVAFLDSDAGYPLDQIAQKIRTKGWAAIISSTHSHMTTETRVKRSNWERWKAQQPEIDGMNLPAAFLEEEKGYLADVAVGAVIDRVDGEHLIFQHAPCPKFRIAIPLARPWVATEYKDQTAANAAWKERVEALAHALQLDHDQSCTDTSRLFYLPRRPAGGVAPETAVIDGTPCDVFALRAPAEEGGLFGAAREEAPASPKKKRKPRHDGPTEWVDGEGEVHDLTRWARRHGLHFEIVSALKARKPEVFVGRLADGVKHHIRCPNEDEHTNAGADVATFATNASEANNKGFVIHCRHSHCTDRDRLFFVRRMLEEGWLSAADLTDPDFMSGRSEDEAPRPGPAPGIAAAPVIRYVAGQLPEIVDQAEDALLKADLGIYQRGAFIVRPGKVRVTVPRKGEVDALRVLEVGVHALVEAMTTAADWERYDGRSETWVPIDAPAKVAETYRQRAGRWRLPVLTGVINAPTLRPDGTILARSGYDPATGLLLDLRGSTFPEIRENPTKAHADKALTALLDLISTFPFVSETDRSVALSALLTAVVRRSLPTAPMHAFTAPTAGSGKSKLVDIASVISTGREASVIAQGKDEVEMEKRLSSLLLAGDQIVAIDNCDLPVGGDMLCQMLTQPMVRMRILGKSETPELLTNSLVTATGNNLVLAGDMTRRALLCRIDPGVERPELREFDFDPVERAKQDRGLYVAAVLTILRAYFVAGRPEQKKPLGSFGDWSRVVRDALLWLGQEDPTDSMDEARKSDPKLEALSAVLSGWREAIGTTRLSVRKIIERAISTHIPTAENGRVDFNAKPELRFPEFREALLAAAGDGGVINGKRLGKWLMNHKDRIVDGYRIKQMPMIDGTTTWQVEGVNS